MIGKGERFKHVIRNDGMTSTGFEYVIRRAGGLARERMAKGSSALWFIDWRQYPLLFAVLESVDWRISGLIVWDKGAMGMGVGFRRQHELVIHASVGSPVMADKGTPDVLQARRVRKGHAGAKPPELVARLLSSVARPGAVVYDPFIGGGATLEAAEQAGMVCYGMDVDPAAIESVRERWMQNGERIPLEGWADGGQ